MANWQMKIDFSQAKNDYDGDQDVQKLAKGTVDEIKQKLGTAKLINQSLGEDLELEILPRFEEIAEDSDMTVDDYDDALEELYDWADTALDDNWNGKKMAWIVP